MEFSWISKSKAIWPLAWDYYTLTSIDVSYVSLLQFVLVSLTSWTSSKYHAASMFTFNKAIFVHRVSHSFNSFSGLYAVFTLSHKIDHSSGKPGSQWVPACLAGCISCGVKSHCQYHLCVGKETGFQCLTFAYNLSVTSAACATNLPRTSPERSPWAVQTGLNLSTSTSYLRPSSQHSTSCIFPFTYTRSIIRLFSINRFRRQMQLKHM